MVFFIENTGNGGSVKLPPGKIIGVQLSGSLGTGSAGGFTWLTFAPDATSYQADHGIIAGIQILPITGVTEYQIVNGPYIPLKISLKNETTLFLRNENNDAATVALIYVEPS